MLEQVREICVILNVTANQLDPFLIVPIEDDRGGAGASESDTDI